MVGNRFKFSIMKKFSANISFAQSSEIFDTFLKICHNVKEEYVSFKWIQILHT